MSEYILSVLRKCQAEYLNAETEESIVAKVTDDGVDLNLLVSIRPNVKFNHHNEYWSTLGLNNLQMKSLPTVDFVLMNNGPFFANENVTDIWNVGGVCATGKSWICGNIRKSNKHLFLISHNTHPSNAMGYIFSSLKMQTKDEGLWDRLFFNNYLWYYIWMAITDVHVDFANYGLPCPSEWRQIGESTLPKEKLDLWNAIFKAINPHVIEYLANFTRNIIIVDSDERRAYERLRNRGQGSDVERSFWPFYIRLQNYFYAKLHELYPCKFCIIDLSWFDGNQQLMQDVIQTIIERKKKICKCKLFDTLVPQNAKSILKEEEIQNERFRPIQTLLFTEGSKELNSLWE